MINRTHPPLPVGRPVLRPLEFEETILSNGIPLYLIPHHVQPFISLRLVFRCGARNDGDLAGLADMTCDLLSAGAGSRDAIAFADAVERLGADLGTDAGRDIIRLELDTLTRFLPEGLPLAADMVRAPLFDPEDLERERKQKLAVLRQNRSDPDWLAGTTLRRALYGSSPYGHPIEGDEASIPHLTIEACREFHRKHLTPENAFFVAAGDITPEAIGGLLEDYFGEWRGEASIPFSPLPSPASPTRRILVIDRPGSAQAAIRVGRIGLPRTDPDMIPLRTLNTLLGDYFNSRLNILLRESMGYTYEAWSYVEGTVDPGMIAVGTSVRGDRVGKTLGAIFGELERIATEPVPEEELALVKGYISGRQALASETPEQIADMVTTIALHNLPADYYSNVIEQTRDLTAERLLEVGSRLLRPEEMTVVVAGDAEQLREELGGFGDVQVVKKVR